MTPLHGAAGVRRLPRRPRRAGAGGSRLLRHRLRRLPHRHGPPQRREFGLPRREVVDTTIPQVDYSNSLACAEAACHGAVNVPPARPGLRALRRLPCRRTTSGRRCATCHPTRRPSITGPPRRVRSPTAAATTASSPPPRRRTDFRLLLCHSDMDQPPCRPSARSATSPEVRERHVHVVPQHAGLTGREQVHTATPGAGVSCASCHGAHYADLGACPRPPRPVPEAHHGVVAVDVECAEASGAAVPRCSPDARCRQRGPD